jgi:uncharacterized membrane protein YeaQ/YmgE (transglycosylase-associated protein family)
LAFVGHLSFVLRHFLETSLLNRTKICVALAALLYYAGVMLHLIWYIIVGFLAGCVAKALLHMHLSITWTVVLGIIGSIIGGAVTHLFYPPSAGGRFHPGGIIVSILGAILVLFLWHKFHLRLPRA